MSNDKFIECAKEIIVSYFNEKRDITDSEMLEIKDIYVVWLCKTLQNNKALLSTTVSDGMYYEITYNGDNDEFYLDAYKKWENKLIKR